jgi:hypothetical protein
LQAAATPANAEQSRPEAQSRPERLTMSAFIARLRQDAALRLRFTQNPRVVLREHGIDPTPFDLPDRLDEAQLERLLADWQRRGMGSAEGSPSPPPPPPRNVPVPVYGPPPGFKAKVPPKSDPPPGPPPLQLPPKQP